MSFLYNPCGTIQISSTHTGVDLRFRTLGSTAPLQEFHLLQGPLAGGTSSVDETSASGPQSADVVWQSSIRIFRCPRQRPSGSYKFGLACPGAACACMRFVLRSGGRSTPGAFAVPTPTSGSHTEHPGQASNGFNKFSGTSRGGYRSTLEGGDAIPSHHVRRCQYQGSCLGVRFWCRCCVTQGQKQH